MCDSVRLLYLLTLLRVTVARVTGGGTRCVDSSVVWPGGDKGESPGDVWALLSQSAPRTAMSAWGPAEEVDEGVERHGADWQGIKEPYQLELTPSMGAIRPWGHHAIRMKDAFWPWMVGSSVGRSKCLFLGARTPGPQAGESVPNHEAAM